MLQNVNSIFGQSLILSEEQIKDLLLLKQKLKTLS